MLTVIGAFASVSPKRARRRNGLCRRCREYSGTARFWRQTEYCVFAVLTAVALIVAPAAFFGISAVAFAAVAFGFGLAAFVFCGMRFGRRVFRCLNGCFGNGGGFRRGLAAFAAAAVAAAFSGLHFGFGRCGICNGCGRLYVAVLDFRFVGASGGTVAAFVAAAVAVVARFGFVGALPVRQFCLPLRGLLLCCLRVCCGAGFGGGCWRGCRCGLPCCVFGGFGSGRGLGFAAAENAFQPSFEAVPPRGFFSGATVGAGWVWRTPLTAGSGREALAFSLPKGLADSSSSGSATRL